MFTSRHEALRKAAETIAGRYSERELREIFHAPVVILSAPRSGSTLLFETLRCSGALWSIGEESHIVFNLFPRLHPSRRGFDSGGLDESHATPDLCHLVRAGFLALLKNSAEEGYLELPAELRPSQLTLLEKTPRNALSIPFLRRLFPDLRILFLYRDPREAIASIIEAWETGLERRRFITVPNLPGWDRRDWCFLLPPGWRELNGQSLARIAAFQWRSANAAIIRNMEAVRRDRWMPIRYRDLVDDSAKSVREIAEFIGIPFTGALRARAVGPLPHSATTLSAPGRDKWRRHEQDIREIHAENAPLARELEGLCRIAG